MSKFNGISIVMGCYNAQQWIQESVESVLNQTFRNFELIIINDGSTDNTLNILEKIRSFDSRIKIYNQKNMGLTKALNYGVYKSKFDWVARIDADDICEKNRLTEQINYLTKSNNKKLYLIASSWIAIDQFGNEIKINNLNIDSTVIRKRIQYFIPTLSHSTVIFNKDIFKKVGGYRESL